MKQILYKLFEHQYLGREEARIILQNIAQGKYNDVQVASLITVFLMRNISVEELCGFRDALLEMRLPVDLSDFSPIDIVGTGGDGKNTFNISTAACFTVAGVNPEKPDVPLNKNDAFQKVQKRRVQEKR